MKNLLNAMIGGAVLLMSLGITSCKDKENEPELPSNPERVILIYAVAANNLSYNLTRDMNEIVQVAPKLDLRNNAVLVYSVTPGGECKLQRLTYNSSTQKYDFTTEKEYPDTPLSVDKERISDVLTYVDQTYDYPKKGLILWSHATGWIPWFAGQSGPKRSFGQDNYQGVRYECNITTLAEAIPEGIFDFIWFDCCYMANIETVYQLRDKADYIIGYVTEIHNDGMPYDLTMPYLLRENPDYNKAALALYNYYDEEYIPVTVSVMETYQLEYLANASRKVFAEGTAPFDLYNINNYSRINQQPFYDMGQFLGSYSGVSAESMAEFKEAMNATVVYKYASSSDWANHYINPSRYSGLSIHDYIDNGSGSELFYETLDWYKATRE